MFLNIFFKNTLENAGRRRFYLHTVERNDQTETITIFLQQMRRLRWGQVKKSAKQKNKLMTSTVTTILYKLKSHKHKIVN